MQKQDWRIRTALNNYLEQSYFYHKIVLFLRPKKQFFFLGRNRTNFPFFWNSPISPYKQSYFYLPLLLTTDFRLLALGPAALSALPDVTINGRHRIRQSYRLYQMSTPAPSPFNSFSSSSFLQRSIMMKIGAACGRNRTALNSYFKAVLFLQVLFLLSPKTQSYFYQSYFVQSYFTVYLCFVYFICVISKYVYLCGTVLFRFKNLEIKPHSALNLFK